MQRPLPAPIPFEVWADIFGVTLRRLDHRAPAQPIVMSRAIGLRYATLVAPFQPQLAKQIRDAAGRRDRRKRRVRAA
jgi:hypothetical protein